MLINLFRFYRSSPRFLIIALLVICVNLWYFRTGIRSAWAIVNLPFVWNRHASDFLISKEYDDFDLTFANYSLSMDSSLPTYPSGPQQTAREVGWGKAGLSRVSRGLGSALLDRRKCFWIRAGVFPSIQTHMGQIQIPNSKDRCVKVHGALRIWRYVFFHNTNWARDQLIII
jgi:hypothetical protein